MRDVAVVGLGPAGRALASRCLARGLSVLAVDPRPEATWTPTYGLWADELGALPPSVVRARVEHPEIRASGRHRLDRAYLVLDNAALQDALGMGGAEVRRARLSDAEVRGLRDEARIVVDARGARPLGGTPGDAAPAQTAYGIVVPHAAALPALEGAEGLLMDWRTDWASGVPDGPATFLYAIPLGADRILLEETCLAAAPGLAIGALRDRLRRRLLARGVEKDVIDRPLGREVVRIPMRGRGEAPPEGVLAIGTAGRGGNPVTGYSVAHSLRRADELARAFATGATGHADAPPDAPDADPPTPADVLREVGLRALLHLDVPGTLALFDAFGALPAARQRDFMSRDSSAPGLAAAMWGMFARMPGPGRRALVRATVGVGGAGRRPAEAR